MSILLKKIINNYQNQIPELLDLKSQLENILKQEKSQQQKSLLSVYDKLYPLIEKQLWISDNFDEMLGIYQSLFREQELLLSQSDSDKRYHFILSIPIADRPEHLRGCLESIFQLCSLYAYGGKTNGFYSKISVVVVEDSKETKHINKDIELAKEYTKKGLKVHHYGLREQYDLMLKIPADILHSVSSIIGEPSIENFYHKGQAVTRNLSYLKALQLTNQQHIHQAEKPDKENMLYFFVDSDQLFQQNKAAAQGDRYVYGLNYFYYINRIFNENNISLLTGKLVGDPPVSPSVMAVNYLDDMLAFFEQLAKTEAQQDCQFHPISKIIPGDAAYHDMAQLFGFEDVNKSYDYCCPIKQQHNHIDCLKTLALRINYFFFGEHLTRKNYFSYTAPLTAITTARTVYPGNYICNFNGLKYIIPFGKLRLRMSGPTAGRLIQAEISQSFSSSALPMLHNRTLQSDFKDEYRPGVEDNIENIDLADEFERQFFGDLMLFTVDRLSKSAIKPDQYNRELLKDSFKIVEDELLELYENKHNNVMLKSEQLANLVNNKNNWWNQTMQLNDSITQLQLFINNVQHNFNAQSKAYQQIQSPQHRQKRVETMINSLLDYHHDRQIWGKMLADLSLKF